MSKYGAVKKELLAKGYRITRVRPSLWSYNDRGQKVRRLRPGTTYDEKTTGKAKHRKVDENRRPEHIVRYRNVNGEWVTEEFPFGWGYVSLRPRDRMSLMEQESMKAAEELKLPGCPHENPRT